MIEEIQKKIGSVGEQINETMEEKGIDQTLETAKEHLEEAKTTFLESVEGLGDGMFNEFQEIQTRNYSNTFFPTL